MNSGNEMDGNSYRHGDKVLPLISMEGQFSNLKRFSINPTQPTHEVVATTTRSRRTSKNESYRQAFLVDAIIRQNKRSLVSPMPESEAICESKGSGDKQGDSGQKLID